MLARILHVQVPSSSIMRRASRGEQVDRGTERYEATVSPLTSDNKAATMIRSLVLVESRLRHRSCELCARTLRALHCRETEMPRVGEGRASSLPDESHTPAGSAASLSHTPT